MKKILISLLTIGAFWCAQPAMANDPDDYLYVPEVTLNNEGKATVYVWLNTNVTEYNTFTMNLYLPEGFSIEKNSRGKYIFNWNTAEEVTISHVMNYADHDGYVRMLGCSVANEYILDGNHWLFNFTVIAPEGFNTEAQGSFRDIEFAEGTVALHKFDDAYFTIKPYLPTGFEGLNAEGPIDLNAPYDVFSLDGVYMGSTVDKLTTGIYILHQGSKTQKFVVK